MKKVHALLGIYLLTVNHSIQLSYAKSEKVSMPLLSAYVKDVEERLNRPINLGQNLPSPGARATVVFKIDEHGEVSDIHIRSATDSREFNALCIKNVEDRAPFRPFPIKLRVKAVCEPLRRTIVTAEVDDGK